MEYSRDYLVHYYEADCNRRLLLPALIQYFEDIAILDSSRCGLDLEYYRSNNCGWMLLKWDINIHSLPLFGDTVRVSTKVHAMKRFLADREFTLSVPGGAVLVEARSNWLLVDTVKRRPMRISEEQYRIFGVSAESETGFISISDVEGAVSFNIGNDSLFRRQIRAGITDIDTNGHVNNVRYLTWALDSLPDSFYSAAAPESVRVHYLKELACGDEVEVVTKVSETVSVHTICRGNEELAHIIIGWRTL